ncbi:putative iron-sulfur-binding oxidoreductase FadF [subsurface metagenome]
MEVLDEVKDWAARCSRCGTCRFTFNQYLPACPPGQRFHLEGYYPSGRLWIGRGLMEGALSLEDEDVLERIYTCTACRSCDEQCACMPKEHIVEVIEAIRQMAVGAGYLLPAHAAMIDSLKKNDNVLDKPKAERGAWAEGLGLKDITKEKADVVYHAGDMLSFDPEIWGAARDAIALLQQAGVDVGTAGKEEACCGGRAYEIGHLGEFTKYAEHNLEAYNGAGASKLVLSCADGYSHIKLLYPKVNAKMNFEVLHMVEYLDQLIKEGKIKFTKKVPMKVTYHDPCHLGRYNGIYDPPRDILGSIPGLELVEMERIRELSWCCGAGGGVKQAYPDFALWTANERIQEAKATGATALVTSCPWCIRNFKDAIKEYGEKIEVYDIAEIARKAI